MTEAEIVFVRKEHAKWLSHTKQSTLKTYTQVTANKYNLSSLYLEINMLINKMKEQLVEKEDVNL